MFRNELGIENGSRKK